MNWMFLLTDNFYIRIFVQQQIFNLEISAKSKAFVLLWRPYRSSVIIISVYAVNNVWDIIITSNIHTWIFTYKTQLSPVVQVKVKVGDYSMLVGKWTVTWMLILNCILVQLPHRETNRLPKRGDGFVWT